LTLQVKRSGGRSDEAFGCEIGHLTAGCLNARSDGRAWNAIPLAYDNHFLTLKHRYLLRNTVTSFVLRVTS
jgi:hypothetical protein